MSQSIRYPAVGAIEARFRWVTALLLIFLSAMILYRYPPDHYGFYPLCPIHEYLHLDCPGCGMTRAVSALLHGDPAAAVHFNGFGVLVLLPLAAAYAAVCFRRSFKDEAFRWPTIPRPVTIAVITLAVLFTFARNL